MTCMIWPSQSLKSKDVLWFLFFYYDKNKAWSHIKKIFEPDMKNPHTTIFTSITGCGKSPLVLELIEREYNKDFDCIIIIYPTLRWNKI